MQNNERDTEGSTMGKRILIVDDDVAWVRMLAIRLDQAGYQVEVAFDALQALTQAVRQKPDLILLDLVMPVGGGLKALENLRTSTKTFSVPIIVVSAKEWDKETKAAAKKYGISGYFMKPINVDTLLERLEEVLVKK
jgi:DNA-binding response OmpR family regulator